MPLPCPLRVQLIAAMPAGTAMIIPVTSEGTGTKTEWVLFDLQGHVLPTDGVASCDGLTIGHLVHRPGAKSAAVQIGNHRINGSVVELKKPLVLIRKRDVDAAAAGSAGCGTEYVVAGVVRRKFLFEDRPQPIIGTMAVRRAEVP